MRLASGASRVSSRINVRSVVGRFLEHSRIFVFANGGETEVYLGSADWMPRNLYERVEVIFRLKDPVLCHKVCSEILLPYFADNEKARFLSPNGESVRKPKRGVRLPTNGTRFNVQEFFVDTAEDMAGLIAPLPSAAVESLHNSPLYQVLTTGWGLPETVPIENIPEESTS